MRAGHYIDVITFRALAELRAEATRTYAGYLWWIIQPLLSLGVYYVAFGWVFDRGRGDFALFLFSGIVLWQWFVSSVLRCSETLIQSRGLMQQVDLHKTVFPLSVVMVNTVKFTVTLGLLLVVLVAAGFMPGSTWIAIVPILMTELLFIAALGCTAAMISPFLPDFHLILSTVLHLMFFLSGIIYDLAQMPAHLARILRLNPMAVLIEQFRQVTMNQTWPDWSMLALPLGQALLLLCVAVLLLQRFNKVYPKLG